MPPPTCWPASGCPRGADDQAVADAHGRISEFLDGAPDEIRNWADRRQREADRLLALLTGPDEERASLAARAAPAASGRRPLPKPALVALGALAVFALVFGVYWFGRPTSDLPATAPAQGATPAAAAPALDQTKVAELMAKIQANPKDTDALNALAALYYAAGDFANARGFAEKILAFDPTNDKALVGAGAAAYNSGDLAYAEKVWTQAAQLYPDNPDIHYDLGFLYMTTRRTDLMQAEWEKVVKLAPDSEMAKTVASHVGAVAVPAPTPSK